MTRRRPYRLHKLAIAGTGTKEDPKYYQCVRCNNRYGQTGAPLLSNPLGGDCLPGCGECVACYNNQPCLEQ